MQSKCIYFFPLISIISDIGIPGWRFSNTNYVGKLNDLDISHAKDEEAVKYLEAEKYLYERGLFWSVALAERPETHHEEDHDSDGSNLSMDEPSGSNNEAVPTPITAVSMDTAEDHDDSDGDRSTIQPPSTPKLDLSQLAREEALKSPLSPKAISEVSVQGYTPFKSPRGAVLLSPRGRKRTNAMKPIDTSAEGSKAIPIISPSKAPLPELSGSSGTSPSTTTTTSASASASSSSSSSSSSSAQSDSMHLDMGAGDGLASRRASSIHGALRLATKSKGKAPTTSSAPSTQQVKGASTGGDEEEDAKLRPVSAPGDLAGVHDPEAIVSSPSRRKRVSSGNKGAEGVLPFAASGSPQGQRHVYEALSTLMLKEERFDLALEYATKALALEKEVNGSISANAQAAFTAAAAGRDLSRYHTAFARWSKTKPSPTGSTVSSEADSPVSTSGVGQNIDLGYLKMAAKTSPGTTIAARCSNIANATSPTSGTLRRRMTRPDRAPGPLTREEVRAMRLGLEARIAARKEADGELMTESGFEEETEPTPLWWSVLQMVVLFCGGVGLFFGMLSLTFALTNTAPMAVWRSLERMGLPRFFGELHVFVDKVGAGAWKGVTAFGHFTGLEVIPATGLDWIRRAIE